MHIFLISLEPKHDVVLPTTLLEETVMLFVSHERVIKELLNRLII